MSGSVGLRQSPLRVGGRSRGRGAAEPLHGRGFGRRRRGVRFGGPALLGHCRAARRNGSHSLMRSMFGRRSGISGLGTVRPIGRRPTRIGHDTDVPMREPHGGGARRIGARVPDPGAGGWVRGPMMSARRVAGAVCGAVLAQGLIAVGAPDLFRGTRLGRRSRTADRYRRTARPGSVPITQAGPGGFRPGRHPRPMPSAALRYGSRGNSCRSRAAGPDP